MTERALKAWQAKNGLVADGIAGPLTFGKMFD
jgi:peptidoglycan hydrolase-like protein with peptidoglycan-binding domain